MVVSGKKRCKPDLKCLISQYHKKYHKNLKWNFRQIQFFKKAFNTLSNFKYQGFRQTFQIGGLETVHVTVLPAGPIMVGLNGRRDIFKLGAYGLSKNTLKEVLSV